MTRIRRFGLVAVALMIATFAVAGTVPARAQDYGLFGGLFGGLQPQPRAPAYPGYGRGYGYGSSYGYGYAQPRQSDSYYQRPRRRVERRKPPEQVQRDVTPKEKAAPPKNASMFVYVFGDSMGQMLAVGLDDAFSARQDVAIVHKARGPTGLASNAYNWPKAIDELLAGHDTSDAKADAAKADSAKADSAKAAALQGGDTQKPAAAQAGDAQKPPKVDVAVMMIGANDHQPMDVDGKTLSPGSPDWKAAYTQRVLAIDEAFRAKKIPLVWVGVPITRDDDFADAMAALNDIYRETAAKTGAIYVDTWEAFSDDDGDFSAYGPDINGQTVRLRAPDGVNFTRAGARKLSHFVEAHVSRALEGKTPVPQLPTAEAPDANSAAVKGIDAKGAAKKTTVAARPEVGPIRNLNELPSATSGTLASFDGKAARTGDTGAAISRAAATSVPVERADNAKWSSPSLPEP